MARREFQMPNVIRQEGPRPYWYIRYRRKVMIAKDQIRKEEKWHRLGYCSEMTKRQAERRREEIMREINREVYTIQSQIVFGEFVTIYLQKHVSTLAPGPRQKYISLLKNHILPTFGENRMCDVQTEAVQTFLNQKDAEGLSWWTRNDLKGIMSGVFTKAADWGYSQERNPAQRVSLGRKRPQRMKRILSDEQIRSLIAVLPACIRLMVLTASSTGMRVSEVIGLRWRCVDLDRGLVHVEERYYRGDVGEPKTERSKRVLSLGLLLAPYRQFKPGDALPEDYVFERNGEPLDDRQIIRNVLRPAAKRLGIYFPGFGWHTFRRQNLTLIQEVGATPFEAMAQAGHSRPVMTSEYTVVGFDRMEQAVLRLQPQLFVEGGSDALK